MKKFLFILSLFFVNGILTAQVNFTSSNLPIVVIDTYGAEIPNEPKITAHMGVIFNGEGVRNFLTDAFNNYNGMIGIEIRGSSTQMFPKKQYAVEIRDIAGNDSSVSLLGMPKEADWIFSAPYSDKTLMRDMLAYKLSNDLGRYATRTQFFELVINDDYRGVYVLEEKIKRDKNRVDITRMTPDDNSGDALTGGYIVKIDKPEGSQTGGWYSSYPAYSDYPQNIYYQYHYPSEDDITSAQKNYIQNFIGDFEDLMFSSDYNNTFGGYYDMIDIDAYVDYYLVNEFSKNVDAYRLSSFLYKDRDSEDSKLKAGPVWDFNHSFGNCDYDQAFLDSGWEVLYRNFSDFLTPFWFRKLFTDQVFYNSFIARWEEVKNTVFDLSELNSFIDEMADYVGEGANRNFIRWPVIGTYVWPNYFIGATYEDEINYMKNWIEDRRTWMDNFLPSVYTKVNWVTHDELIPLELNAENKFPLSFFYGNYSNADEIRILSNNSSTDIGILGDTVYIFPRAAGTISVRCIAYRNFNATAVSPIINMSAGTSDVSNGEFLPEGLRLYQNYPNPFNPSTVISWQMPAEGKVSIKIYDILGREISTAVEGEFNPGFHEIRYDASSLPGGIYFYRLTCGNFNETKKMAILR